MLCSKPSVPLCCCDPVLQALCVVVLLVRCHDVQPAPSRCEQVHCHAAQRHTVTLRSTHSVILCHKHSVMVCYRPTVMLCNRHTATLCNRHRVT